MADGTAAADRLERLLHILPAASAEGGVAIARLAADLGVDESTVVADLTEVTARSFYHPPGSGDDIQIRLEPDRVTVWTKGAFERPVKLSPLETFCLALGLRGAGRGAEREARRAAAAGRHAGLLRRVERHLASGPLPPEPVEGFHATDAAPDPDGVRELLADGARTRSRCRISYLKPDAPEPEARVVHPYAVVHAEGHWYAVAWCETAGGARAFRLDRIVDAHPEGGGFEPRDDVDVESFLGGGRVYDDRGEAGAVVRYSRDVARWVAEWADDPEPAGDGALEVRHEVADPGWLVRHVVSYGGDAEVVEPLELREAVARYAGGGGG